VSPARVEFFYDYSSPWTYLAFTRIEDICRAHDAELVWRPMLVGGIFNTVNPSVYQQREQPVPAMRLGSMLASGVCASASMMRLTPHAHATIELAAVTTIGDFLQVQSNPALVTLSVPLLLTASHVLVANDAKLQTLALPRLVLTTGRIEITTQNHGFVVDLKSLEGVAQSTHVHLNDGTSEGLEAKGHKAFSVQYHPEAAAGPHDALYLFDRFRRLMDAR
jgi:hypothetical protein